MTLYNEKPKIYKAKCPFCGKERYTDDIDEINEYCSVSCELDDKPNRSNKIETALSDFFIGAKIVDIGENIPHKVSGNGIINSIKLSWMKIQLKNSKFYYLYIDDQKGMLNESDTDGTILSKSIKFDDIFNEYEERKSKQESDPRKKTLVQPNRRLELLEINDE